MISERLCPRCDITKPADQFHKNKTTATGLQVYCIECFRAINREWYQQKGQAKKEKYRQYSAQRRIELYGITTDQYWAMSEKQNNRCAICDQEENAQYLGKTKRLAIDHDHKTGKVRGLLCADCNMAIGIMKEDQERLRAAIAYLSAHQG